MRTPTAQFKSIDVVCRRGVIRCATGLKQVTVAQRSMNIIDKADTVWKAAAQVIRAGKVQKVNFMMRGSGIQGQHIDYFVKRMQQTVPDLVADGRIVVT